MVILEGEVLWDFTVRDLSLTNGGVVLVRPTGNIRVRQSPGVTGNGKIENMGVFDIALKLPAEFSLEPSQFVNFPGASCNIDASPPSITIIRSRVTNEGTISVAAGNVLQFDGNSDHEDKNMGQISLQEGSRLVVKNGQVKPRIVTTSGDTISEGGVLDLSALKVNSLRITSGTVTTGDKLECEMLVIEGGELVLRDETIVGQLTMNGGAISGPGQITINEWVWRSGRVQSSPSALSTIFVQNSLQLESGEYKFLGKDTVVEGSSLWVDTYIELTLAKDLKFSQGSSLEIVSSAVVVYTNGGIFENSGNIVASLIEGRLAFYASFHNKG